MYKFKKKKYIFTNYKHIISLLLFIFLINGVNGLKLLETIKNTFLITLNDKIQNNQYSNDFKSYMYNNNIDINILEIINKDSIENYLIYWKQGYVEKKYEQQLKLNQYIFYKFKTIFWMELIIRPLVYIYLWFPNFYGFGFYSGQEYQEICSSISSISSIMWNNHLYKPLCYELISKKFNVFLYTNLILIYFFVVLIAVKNVFYLVIKKNC